MENELYSDIKVDIKMDHLHSQRMQTNKPLIFYKNICVYFIQIFSNEFSKLTGFTEIVNENRKKTRIIEMKAKNEKDIFSLDICRR